MGDIGIDDLLAWAKRQKTAEVRGTVAFTIVETFSVHLPCDFEDFIVESGRVIFPEGAYTFADLSPQQARGIAIALLRAADKAER